jgi:hypothetical protein
MRFSTATPETRATAREEERAVANFMVENECGGGTSPGLSKREECVEEGRKPMEGPSVLGLYGSYVYPGFTDRVVLKPPETSSWLRENLPVKKMIGDRRP